MSASAPIRRRLQQSVLAELGLRVIGQDGPAALADYAAHAVADALGTPIVGVFEAEDDALVLRAGVGWSAGSIGVTVSTDSPHVSAALASSDPVALGADVPELLRAASVRAGLTVRLGGAGEPAGALGAYAPEALHLDDDERAFLAAVAAVLAGALERARTEQALRESEARAHAVLETTVDGVITIDAEGAIESFNPAAERIFGYAAREVVGRNVHVLMPEPYHAEHDGYIRAYHETGRRKIIGIGREVVGRRKDGSTFPLDLAVSEVRLGGRTIFTGLVRDISERRVLEQEVLRIAEAERRRIGQDLHDGLGQMLTGTALIARGVARRVERGETPTPEEAGEVVGLIKEADAYARSLARGLVPVDVEANGLAAALERLAANAERLFGIRCTVESVGEEDTAGAIPQDAAVHLFRIAQEAVSNAARHGEAGRVGIALARGAEQVRLRIRDDGRGFPEDAADSLPRDVGAPARPEDNRGMGVRIMHYRARVLGGRLDIRPGAGGGTVVTCTIPLTPEPLAP